MVCKCIHFTDQFLPESHPLGPPHPSAALAILGSTHFAFIAIIAALGCGDPRGISLSKLEIDVCKPINLSDTEVWQG
jgi:hypothetical protein